MTNAISQGRADLANWEADKPANFYLADTNLQNVLTYHLGEKQRAELEPTLDALGTFAATDMDQMAKVEDQLGNHPQLVRWSGIGERTESIQFHPYHDAIGRKLWDSGVLSIQAEPGHIVQQMAQFYLMSYNGEAGHTCSITCTAGLIRALQLVGDESLQARFLPRLLDSDFNTMFHAAQFLTEVQGGSDVGANAAQATPADDGVWHISGEKWFCSNINSDLFVLTARLPDAPGGTRGLGLFLVPRLIQDTSGAQAINGFYVRRLKDKLGTRTLASAEVDFIDAVAYPIGALDEGFKNAVELVLNTSRLMNAVACAAITARAALEAGSYACVRQAFGQPIAAYPMVQETYADIVSEQYASVASSFALAALVDRKDTGAASDEERAVYRMLVNVNKYITAVRGTETVHQAIEILGGNGAIESFSILPRLYRDMIVLESWEGTHNVLCLQVLNDIQKYGIHTAYFAYIEHALETVSEPALKFSAEAVKTLTQRAQVLLDHLILDPHVAPTHARRYVDACAHAMQAALLLAEAQWELDRGVPTIKPDVAAHYINRRVRRDYDPLEDKDFMPRLERIMGSVKAKSTVQVGRLEIS